MLGQGLLRAIGRKVEEATGERFSPGAATPLGGGCIGSAWEVRDRKRRYFVKQGGPGGKPDLEAERIGLARLGAARAVRVPGPVGIAEDGGQACLVLEMADLGGAPGGKGWAEFGASLAQLHATPVREINRRLPVAERMREDAFGSDRPVEALACEPGWHDPGERPWGDVFTDCWLGFQLRRARERRGFRLEREAALLGRCREALAHAPPASLVHGDLWRGNVGFTPEGEAVVFDPAAHVADAETDLAMTRLFGGFHPAFYEAYHAALPPREGHRLRSDIYALYHVLNHLNLFGGGYAAQAAATADSILAA